jgi:chromosome partitioning protein
MPVIAVINRKGGSGKSTLATHLAGYIAQRGLPVMLGDADRQLSTQAWLRQRSQRQRAKQAPIVGWSIDLRNPLRTPAGVRHVIVDTPGGLRGFELARLAMCVDAIVIPVCNSLFDRESAAECYAELKTLPRIASGQCRVGAIGMRLDSRTRAAETLRAWAESQQLPFIGVLRETQAYVHCIERGLTLFDLDAEKTERDMSQWQPIINWLSPVIEACSQAPLDESVLATRAHQANQATQANEALRTLPTAALRPVRRPVDGQIVPSPVPQPVAARAGVAASPQRAAPPTPARFASLLDALPVPRFLIRRAS